MNQRSSASAPLYLRRRLIIFLDTFWTRDRMRDPRQRPLPSEGPHLPTELRDLLRTDLAFPRYSCGTHKVLQQLASRLLLHQKRELHRAVEEVRYLSEVVLAHVT